MIRLIDKLVQWVQGFGFGSNSIGMELRMVKKLLGYAPNAVVDIGANKGLYTQAVLRMNPQCKLVLFEPSSTNVKILNELFATASEVRLISKAVSDKSGRLDLFADEPGSGLGSLVERDLKSFGLEHKSLEKVEVTTLKQSLPPIIFDLWKLDIEGNEFKALIGSSDLIRKVRVVQFEFGGANIDSRTYFRDFFELFTSNGFEIYRISPLGLTKISSYSERMERFITTNYLAKNKNLK